MAAQEAGARSDRFDELGRLLNRIAEVCPDPGHATEIIDEISQLLWLVSSLDPEAEQVIHASGYVAGFKAARC